MYLTSVRSAFFLFFHSIFCSGNIHVVTFTTLSQLQCFLLNKEEKLSQYTSMYIRGPIIIVYMRILYKER